MGGPLEEGSRPPDGAPPTDPGESPPSTVDAEPALGPGAAQPESGTRTFLIADIRGYTTYTRERGDEAGAALAQRFAEIVADVVPARDGFLLELRGDEALVVFVSARKALRAALDLQAQFAGPGGLDRGVGIGLDAGEAIPVGEGYRGTALNLAARLCAQAGPGETIASEAVIHLAAKVDGIAYVDARSLRLKGYEDAVRAVAVVTDEAAKGRRRATVSGRRPDRRLVTLLAAGGLVLVLIAGALAGGFMGRPQRPVEWLAGASRAVWEPRGVPARADRRRVRALGRTLSLQPACARVDRSGDRRCRRGHPIESIHWPLLVRGWRVLDDGRRSAGAQAGRPELPVGDPLDRDPGLERARVLPRRYLPVDHRRRSGPDRPDRPAQRRRRGGSSSRCEGERGQPAFGHKRWRRLCLAPHTAGSTGASDRPVLGQGPGADRRRRCRYLVLWRRGRLVHRSRAGGSDRPAHQQARQADATGRCLPPPHRLRRRLCLAHGVRSRDRLEDRPSEPRRRDLQGRRRCRPAGFPRWDDVGGERG